VGGKTGRKKVVFSSRTAKRSMLRVSLKLRATRALFFNYMLDLLGGVGTVLRTIYVGLFLPCSTVYQGQNI
jgi:hypothetical protein